MKPGDRIELLSVIESSPKTLKKRKFKVHSIYPKFAVLDTGKYKVCALKTDIRARVAIVI